MFCAILTWLLIFYANFVVLKVILLPFIQTTYSLINSVLFTCVTVLAVASHLRTMLSDPVSFTNISSSHAHQLTNHSNAL